MIEADDIVKFGSWWIVKRLKGEAIFAMKNSVNLTKIEHFC